MEEGRNVGAVLVAGAGIAGMQASLDLANAGFKVYLVDKRPSIGGIMPQLDKTFPTNDCSTCIISPKLIEVAKHPNIEILAYTEILGLEGSAGRFKANLRRKSRYVNDALCVSCGICAGKCPKKVPNEFNRGLNERKAIYLSFVQAVPAVYTIDRENCIYFQKGKCRACEKFCERGAIDFTQQDREEIIEVGAVIAATGFEPTNPALRPEFGYGRYPNVVTSIEFERILSAAGPYGGHIRRPSDGAEPKRLAWIQCVGSRDASVGKDYCSYACCMYATKQAVVAREHDKGIEPTIFFIDMRAQGKGFDRYYERAKSEYGVSYVRSMVSRITQDPSTLNLGVHFINERGAFEDREFDMVVLSVGFSPGKDAIELAQRLGIRTDKFGFSEAGAFNQVRTNREGVYVCGVAQAPKDIPESVIQASGAAAEAMALLSEARDTLTALDTGPSELSVVAEEPRIGVFVCHCGHNIASVVDVEAVAAYARSLPHVVYADHTLFACSSDAQRTMGEIIRDHGLNRVVVASCSPRTHEGLFQDTIQRAGLNKYLMEMANIRDQCSWVHAGDPAKATEKAKDLVRMSIARSALLEPLHEIASDVVQRGLVIGGGAAGMEAALNLARQGFETVLVEKSGMLGGNALELRRSPQGGSVRQYLEETVRSVTSHPLIRVLLNSEVKDSTGHVGKFKSLIKGPDGEAWIEHGITIVATGGEEYSPVEYFHGQDPMVMTQRSFHRALEDVPSFLKDINTVVMIQCVGSRDELHPYCSRICCNQAVLNALRIKALKPETRVFVLFRDIRTYGLNELSYKEAREAGVQFLRFDVAAMPTVEKAQGGFKVKVMDANLREEMEIMADCLVLSAAVRPNPSSKALASTLKLPMDQDGFFLEAHVKLRPLDFAASGYFLCGLAHGPKSLDESIAQAKGAASRAASILSRKTMTVGGQVAVIDRENCVVCLTCVRSCPFGVPKVAEDGFVMIDPAECHGCGICASACPRKLIQVQHMRDDQIIAKSVALCS
jgi:heterodisulfide reductase subunit A